MDIYRTINYTLNEFFKQFEEGDIIYSFHEDDDDLYIDTAGGFIDDILWFTTLEF